MSNPFNNVEVRGVKIPLPADTVIRQEVVSLDGNETRTGTDDSPFVGPNALEIAKIAARHGLAYYVDHETGQMKSILLLDSGEYRILEISKK